MGDYIRESETVREKCSTRNSELEGGNEKTSSKMSHGDVEE